MHEINLELCKKRKIFNINENLIRQRNLFNINTYIIALAVEAGIIQDRELVVLEPMEIIMEEAITAISMFSVYVSYTNYFLGLPKTM